MLVAAVAAGWFAFWSGDATSPARVWVQPTNGRCLDFLTTDVAFFGASTRRFADGSVGARAPFRSDPQPLFAAFRTTGFNSIFVRGGGRVVRLRVDGRVVLSIHTRLVGCTEIVYDGRGPHRLGLELGPGARLVGLTSIVTPDPLPASAPLAIFLGDSYTEGAGGSTPTGYAFRAGWAKGWNVRIDALAGTGFLNRAHKQTYAERLPAVLARHPKIVVVAGGINDYGNYTNAQITHAANALFARIAASGARLIVLSPWEPPHFRVPSYHQLVARVGAAARAHGARYIDTSAWLTPGLIAPDGIHPNERGYRTIAAKLALRL
jgi:lysophospholipase L1-like esterase